MTSEQSSEIIQQFSNEKVINTSQVTGRGLVNQVFIIATPSKKYVIRTDLDESDITRFEKEKWCAQVSKSHGILTPEVFQVGIAENHPYMIMEHIDGIDGDKADNPNEIWEKMGEYASKMHKIPVSGFGEDMTTPGNFSGSWVEFLDYNISSLNEDDQVLHMGVFTLEKSQQIKDIFINLRDRDVNFGLSHDDLSLKNTIVKNDESVYLIDWGSAHIAPAPHTDLIEILHSSLSEGSEEFRIFLEAYGMDFSEYEALKPMMRDLNLLTQMDKLRWAIDRNQEMIEHFASKVKRIIDEEFSK